MSHLLLAFLDMFVQVLHDFAREESIVLTQVDKQSSISLFGFTFPTASTVFLTLSAFLTSFRLLLTIIRTKDFGGVGIVIQESTEGHGNDFLDEVFLVHILEVATDVLHEGGNLIFVNIHFLNHVHGAIQLLGTNLAWGW